MEMIESKYCVIIPAYNAAANIDSVINLIQSYYPQIRMIVIDDGSIDDTALVVSKYPSISIYRHADNEGKGAAIKTGIEKARQEGFIYAIFLDADMQHAPSKISDFIKMREQYNLDLVLGKRSFLRTSMPFHRILSNSITSFLISLRTGKRVHDSQCGYRLINLSKISLDKLVENRFQFESEFLIKMVSGGIKYSEVTIPTIYSKSVSYINNIMDTIRFIKLYLSSFFWF
jgi:glycosyltransferase involved in cell wall biosynthesis